MRKLFLLLLALTLVMADCGQPEMVEVPDVPGPARVEEQQEAPSSTDCPFGYECQSRKVWDI